MRAVTALNVTQVIASKRSNSIRGFVADARVNSLAYAYVNLLFTTKTTITTTTRLTAATGSYYVCTAMKTSMHAFWTSPYETELTESQPT